MKSLTTIPSILLATLSFSLIGCSTTSKQSATPALFNTKAEAQKAAKSFNCTGAHKMGQKWMPCEMHGDHKKHAVDSHHHNH